MALIKHKELKSMNEKDRSEKLKELRLLLVKGQVTANKASSKTKEIKRAIARLLTMRSAPVSASKEQGK